MATRFFTVQAIGESAAVIGTCSFIASLSLVGLDHTLVRFGSDRAAQSRLIQGAFALSPTVAFVLTSLAVPVALTSTLPPLSPDSLLIWLAVPATAAAATAALLGEAALLALDKPKAIVGTNLLVAITRLALIATLVAIPAPIFSAYLISWLVGIVALAGILRRHVRFDLAAVLGGIQSLRGRWTYAMSSYAASTLDVAALALLPLWVLHLTNAATAGVFQVVWLIASVLYVLPTSVARAVFAFNSRDAKRSSQPTRILLLSVAAATLPAAIVAVGSQPILSVLGRPYEAGAGALVWFASATPVVAYSSLRVSSIRVAGAVQWLVFGSVVHLIALLAGLAAAMPTLGLVGVGMAWFVSQIVFAVVVSFPRLSGTDKSSRRQIRDVRDSP